MPEHPRIFTLAEATRMLPWLRERLTQLQAAKRERDEAIRRLASMTPAMRSNGSAVEGARVEEKVETLGLQMRTILTEIDAAGIEVKDIDRGLVDFPAVRDGRVIYLCWLMSEPEIAFWHEIDTGFAGRRPIEGGSIDG